MDSLYIKWIAPGSQWKGCVKAGCRVECCFCPVELLEVCCYCRGLEHCRMLGNLILPCRMLGYTGSNCWSKPAQNELCISCGRINSVCRIKLVFVVTGLHVETLETLLDSSWNEVFEESLLGSSLSFPLEIILFAELLYLSG